MPTATAPPTDTAAPLATATPSSPLVPLAQPGLPVPNTTNGLLSSPLDGALTGAQQPISYTIPTTLTLQQPAPLAVYALTPTLPAYGLMRSPVSPADALDVARQLGAEGPVTPALPAADGSIAASVRIDAIPYTLTVYAGYGTPWFSLHALDPGVGYAAPPRVIDRADAWLSARHLLRDLHMIDAGAGNVSYQQDVGGLPLLGVAAQLRFDGSGMLRDLRYEYTVPRSVAQEAAMAPTLAADAVVDFNQGLYRGPDTSVITGTAAITGMELAVAGVHGVTGDYLEPVYALTGSVPTTSGPLPFSLYVPALQFSRP